MNDAALVSGFGEHLSHCLKHPKTLISHNQLYAFQTASSQPLEERDPACLVLLHALCRAKHLAEAVFIDRDGNKHTDILVLATPIAAQIDPIHIDIRIFAALQRTVSPVLYMYIGFLVQLTDSGRRHLCSP